MIARLWHGEVPSAKANAYHDYLNESGLKDYKKVKGNRGVFLLKKEKDDITHFYTLTFWDNMNAIEEFAGAEPEKARYYTEDKDYLLVFEPYVQHFDVLEGQMPAIP
ncbi:MAG: antibiotic biosynthesis monooxygenase [Chitinophagaceae bacterium]